MLPLKLKPEIFRPTRRAFLLGAAVAGTGNRRAHEELAAARLEEFGFQFAV